MARITAQASPASGSSTPLGSANPQALGTAAAGASTNASREDHVHPTTGLKRAVTAKTANYTAGDRDLVLADASGGAFTVTLPAVASGLLVTVKKVDSSGNAVTVSPASGTVDGAASVVIATQYLARDFVSDGTNWFLV